jgi:hypothetical protein
MSAINPTLQLNFAKTKRLDPRITFSRADTGASQATYFGADGLLKYAGIGEPRFDHDPVTGESLGLLIEEQRANLLVQSQTFQTTWNPGSNLTVTADATTSPAGDMTMDRLVESSVASVNRGMHQDVTGLTAGSTTVLTVYAKEDATSAKRYLNLSFTIVTATTNDFAYVRYDLATGLVTAAAKGGTSVDFPNAPVEIVGASAVHVGNGVYRCSLTVTSANTTVIRSRIGMCASPTGVTGAANGLLAYTGDGTSGIYIWGAQLEVGSFPTSYIPTTAAAVTRNPDIASMSGVNFSSWYNQSEGSFVVNGDNYGTSFNAARWLSITDGTIDNEVGLFRSPIADTHPLSVGTVNQGNVSVGDGAGGYRKLAFAIKTNDRVIVRDGVVGGSTSTSTLPTALTRMDIGSRLGTTRYMVGHIARLTYYPKRLPNATLQALTK